MKPLAGQAANAKGARRRRFWSSDEKRRMVAESFAPGASVSKVAQRYGVNANLLFTWRRRDARSAASGGVEAVELLTGEGRGRKGARRASRGAGSSRSHGDRACRRGTDPCRGGR